MKHLILILTLLLNSLALLAQYDIVFDSTFSGDGVIVLPYSIANRQGVFLQSDGKIVLMCQKKVNLSTGVFTVLRLTANGVLDTTFNNTGINNNSMISQQSPFPVGVLLPNNDLIVGGSGPYSPWPIRGIVLHKYREDGVLDDLFGNGGAVTFTEDSLSMNCKDLIRYDDTSLLVLFEGYFYGTGTYKNVLCKINTNGRIDSSFAVNGRLELSSTLFYDVKNLALGKDGSIYIAGTSNSHDHVIKLNADLTIDPAFQYKTSQYTSINAIAVDEDGKVIIAESEIFSGFGLRRFMPDGSLDNSFSKDGILQGIINFDVGGFSDLIEQSDGKLLLPFTNSAAAIRVNPNGTMDYSFDLDGLSQIVSNVNSSGLALQPDGKIIFGIEIASNSIKIIRVKTRP